MSKLDQEVMDALKYATEEIERWYDMAKIGKPAGVDVIISIGQFRRLERIKEVLKRNEAIEAKV